MDNKNFGKRPVHGLVAWIALFVSVVALVLGWSAYNKVDTTTVADDYSDEIEQTVIESNKNLELAQARLQLVGLRAAIAANTAAEETADELAEIRSDIAYAFEETGEETIEAAVELDSNLNQLETEVRKGSADAVDTLEEAIAALEKEIRTED